MKISFITLVNNKEEYAKMCATLPPIPSDIELIDIEGAVSAAQGLNAGIRTAKADLLVLCHQDVRFPVDFIPNLEAQVKEVGDDFGVLGTFGISLSGEYIGHVMDPHQNPKMGDLPQEAQTLDEHCLVIRKSRRLKFDEDMGGFHFYGADICLLARLRGLKCYAIEAPVVHMSGGKRDEGFQKCRDKFQGKWKGFMGFNPVMTTCALVDLTPATGAGRLTAGLQLVNANDGG